MKFVLTFVKPPARGRSTRVSKKKECVEICKEGGLRSLNIWAVSAVNYEATVTTGRGDRFDITEATSDDIRVLSTSLARVSKPAPRTALWSPDAEVKTDDDDPFADDSDDKSPDEDFDPDEGL